MATEISLIASLLHLRCVDNGIEARQAVESGSYLVREDDVKAVVVKLRAAHDKSRDEMDAMRERAEKAEAQLASITGVMRLELVAAERVKDGDVAVMAKTKRRKVWANFYAGEGPRPDTWGTHLGTKAEVRMAAQEGAEQVLLVESRPGDVVLSREEREAVLAEVHRLMDSAAAFKDMRPLLALLSLRGGR